MRHVAGKSEMGVPQAGGPCQAAMRASAGQLVAPHGGRLSQPAQRTERPTDRQPGEQMMPSGNMTLLSWEDTGARTDESRGR